VWLMLIGGPGWGKTETLLSGAKLPHMHIAATLTEASLLSGTRKKERDSAAKGGLLRQIGPFGFLVLKDFTSVLSMNRDLRTGLLAALREIYDGSWTRHVGVDGGLELSWQGKLAVIGGCTGTIDRYHAVIGAMGERFVFYRFPELSGREQAKGALHLLGKEVQMRAELSDAVSEFFESLTLPDTPPPLTEAEQERLIALASLVVRARSAVERDGYSHEIELIPDPEAPSRLTLTLARLYAGLKTIGVNKMDAAGLKSSKDLTDSGKAGRLRTLAHDTKTRLQAQKKVINEYDQRLSVESAKLSKRAQRTPQDVLVAELRAQEIRRYLNELDPLELQARYLAAAADPTFHEMAEAIENAPLAMLDATVLDEGRQLRAAAIDSEQASLIADLQQMREVISSALRSAISVVEEDVPGDPTADAARGGGDQRMNPSRIRVYGT
jgi:hypothetical protein